MIESIRLDIVDLDDGYNAYYVDGFLYRECGEHDIRMIIEIMGEEKYLKILTHRCLGSVGRDAMYEGGLSMPNRLGNVPEDWWLERWEKEKS